MNAAEARRAILAACKGIRVENTESDLDAMARAARFVVERLSIHDDLAADAVLAVAEVCLARGDRSVVQLIAFGFLEDLGNITSHEDIEVRPESVRGRLNPATSDLWDAIDNLWVAVARSLPHVDDIFARAGRRSKRLTEAQYQQIESTELRTFVQQTHRRVADGLLVGLPDIVAYESDRGGGPHLTKAARTP